MFHVKHQGAAMSDDPWKPWPRCPADACEETEDVTIMECVPGYTYTTVGGVCGHWVMLGRNDLPMSDGDRAMWDEYFRSADVPRETSEGGDA
jgi:hypothetical protein